MTAFFILLWVLRLLRWVKSSILCNIYCILYTHIKEKENDITRRHYIKAITRIFVVDEPKGTASEKLEKTSLWSSDKTPQDSLRTLKYFIQNEFIYNKERHFQAYGVKDLLVTVHYELINYGKDHSMAVKYNLKYHFIFCLLSTLWIQMTCIFAILLYDFHEYSWSFNRAGMLG